MTVLFEPILALHIINFSSWRNYWGGGGAKRYVCPPPPPPKKNIFIGGGGGGATAPQLPQDRRLWGQATWTSKGGCVQWRIQDLQKKGVGGKIRARSAPCVREARASYGWGPGARRRAPGGVQGQSPCRGPRGRSPRKLSSFQQIRAFKMVVRSDRKCNFSRCNFAYRALVGGRGCGSHQIFRSSW